MSTLVSTRNIPRVHVGDPPSADHYNMIVDAFNELLPAILELQSVDKQTLFQAAAFYIAKAPTGIPARTGDTPGSASVDIYGIVEGDLLSLTDGYSKFRTCYNTCPTAVAANSWIVMRRESATGKFVFIRKC